MTAPLTGWANWHRIVGSSPASHAARSLARAIISYAGETTRGAPLRGRNSRS